MMVMVCAWSATAHATVTATPSTITAPATDVGVQSASSNATTLTRNTGSNPNYDLVIVTGSCTGTGAGTFTLSATSVNIGSPMVTVTYTPTAAGPRSCTVNVNDNGGTTEGTFTISGSGQDPPMMSVGAISPFGQVRVFDNAVAPHSLIRNISVTNSGDRQLQITNVTLTGDYSLDASSPTGTSVNISGGQSRQWTVLFNPSNIGPRAGSITFTSNAGNQTVNFSGGEGTSGEMQTAIASNGNFGTVAGGSTAALDVTLTNSGNNPKGIITISMATVTPGDPMKNWFALSGIPSTIGASGGTIGVTCTPPMGSTDTATAVVSLRADVDGSTAGNAYVTEYTHNVSCTAGASLLALSSAQIDFGSHLVGTTSASQTFTLTNNGNQNASVSFSSVSANRFFFNLGTPGQCGIGANPACVIAPAGNVMLSAQFSPNAEQTITAGFSIASGGPSLGFTLTGRGVDRHLELTETMYTVADTFRNPGSKATITNVPLRNAGEFPILVSEVVVDGEPVWSVVSPVAPFMIGGLETVNLEVAFAPMAAGKADDGQIVILNDDPKFMAGMPRLLLSGNGKDRNVDLTPGAIDVGDTFAGIATRHSINRPEEMLVVINSEVADTDDNNFPIREILVKDIDGKETDVFQVVNRSTGDKLDGFMLNAESSVEVDVIFTPTYPGNFEAFIEVYLDEDPVPQTPIPVRGRALYVDAHGSGGFGCQAGHGSRGAMLLIIGALSLILRRRRR